MGKTVSNLHAKSHRASFIIKQMVGTPLYAYAYTRRKTAEDSKTKKIDLKDNFWGVCREKKPWEYCRETSQKASSQSYKWKKFC